MVVSHVTAKFSCALRMYIEVYNFIRVYVYLPWRASVKFRYLQ